MEHVSQSALISLALYGAAVGVLLGIIYDVFRILRIAVEPSNRLRLLSTVTGSETADGKKPHGETVRTVVIAIEDIIYSVIFPSASRLLGRCNVADVYNLTSEFAHEKKYQILRFSIFQC